MDGYIVNIAKEISFRKYNHKCQILGCNNDNPSFNSCICYDCKNKGLKTIDVLKQVCDNKNFKIINNNLNFKCSYCKSWKVVKTNKYLRKIISGNPLCCIDCQRKNQAKANLIFINSDAEEAIELRKQGAISRHKSNVYKKHLESLHNVLYIRNENNEIIGIQAKNSKQFLSDYFGFNITGYYKNLDTSFVTSKIETAYSWKKNNYNIRPISEEEYYKNKNSVCSQDESDSITYINYIPLDIYINSIDKLPINFIPEGFKIIDTFRTQESNKTNILLDDYLVKNNIKWFVYIKYDELGHPLVVGRSASKLINSSGCDIVFDYWDKNKGPARQYLRDKNLDWNKTQIAIFICNSEEESIKKEKEVQLKYNLFGS